MPVKYFIEYDDIIGVSHYVEIDDPNYFPGSPIQINGFATLSYANVNSPLDVIRGSSLRIDLDADENLTFEDLYTDGQKKIKVKYLRAGLLKFEGWVNPEGWFEDFVTDKWVVSFDCIDGLGYLDDFAFVYDNGSPIIDIKTEIELIALALQRTGLQQNIYVHIDIIYTGMSNRTGILNNVKINANRFIKDDKDTISDCAEVLRSILNKYTACLTSHNGEWIIYRPNAMVDATDLVFTKYTFEGEYISRNTANNFNVQIGSNINDAPIFHVNENQSITLKNSIGAYRIRYEYGWVESLLGNENLISVNGIIDKWTINNPTGLTVPAHDDGNSGFILASIVNGAVTPYLQLTSDQIPLTFDDKIEVTINSIAHLESENVNIIPKMLLKMIMVDNGTTYYMDLSGVWSEVDTQIVVTAANAITWNTIIPATGQFYIELYTPRTDFQLFANFDLEFVSVNISPSEASLQGAIGEFHTFQRKSNPSAQVEDLREVLSGDNDSGLYIGVLYKNDGFTPTQSWNREGKDEDLAILRIMGEETMKMTPRPSKVFTGDIYGFINYLSLITIDGLDGQWMPISYTYNTKENTISLILRQVFNDDLTDIDYKFTLDQGTTVKPTIIG